MLFPHLLDDLGDRSVFVAGIVEQGKLGKSFAARKTGLGQKFLRFGHILRQKLRRIKPGGAGRGKGIEWVLCKRPERNIRSSV